MDGVKDQKRGCSLQQAPLSRPASVMNNSGPITFSYQGCPSPVLALAVVILHPGVLQTDRLGTYTAGA